MAITRTFRGITYTIKTATANSQSLLGTSGPDWIEALGGNNNITTGAGNDVVLAGLDFLLIDNSDDFFVGGAVYWNPRSDAGNNVINVGAGDDYVATWKGSDTVYLGDGNDVYDGAGDPTAFSGNDKVYGEAGNDVIFIYGGGNKIADGGSGNDSIRILDYSGARSKLEANGGTGDDEIFVYANIGDVTINAGSGDNFVESVIFEGVSTSFISAEGGDDLIFAYNPFRVVIHAGEGNNNIFSSAAQSQVTAGSGNDVIEVLEGNSLIYAGEGHNTITTGTGNDNIYTGAGNDIINAGNGRNEIYAGEGVNTITTGSGNDLIYAGAGNDTIRTGAGNDIVYAGQGKNILNLGTGNDIVYSGSGADIFTLNGGTGSVEIRGFGLNDKISLGAGLNGAPLTFTKSNGDTLVKQGSDLLATLKWVQVNSLAIV